MPTAVLFDLYNTLVDGGDRQSERLRAEMAADLNVDPERFGALWYQSWAARSTGALGDAEATVRAVARQAGADPSAAAVRLACARRLAFQRRILWPSAGTLEALDRIRAAGWRTAVVSNCTHETATLWKTTPLAPRFEAAALSVELGIAKPDPAIFLAACTALGVAPAECVYIGDGADNELPAAAALGMSVVQTEEFKPATGAWPRQRVASLGEFAAALLSGQPERSPRSAPAW
jgi:putative hydrolase of the HAD superfamily